MTTGRAPDPAAQAKMVVVTADAIFEDLVRATFGTTRIGLDLVPARLADCADVLSLDGAAVVIADIDAAEETELHALESVAARIGHGPPIVVIMQNFDANVVRRLMQLRIADFLVKPVPSIELVRACARVAKSANDRHASKASGGGVEN